MKRFRSLGIVTGASALASADVLGKMTATARLRRSAARFDLVMEHDTWRGPASQSSASAAFKIHVFDTIRAFETRGVEAIVLPCFLSHTFIGELEANLSLPVASIMTALSAHVRKAFPSVRRVGVLTSDAIRGNGLFERHFDVAHYDVLHPRNEEGVDRVTSAVFGEDGIKSGRLSGRPVELLRAACADLIAQGAEIIVPGLVEIGLVRDALGPLDLPFVDANLVYARHVAAVQCAPRPRRFKIGVVGGVGPAATVDFLAKLVHNTPAACDQDHVKVMVEQDPQIPDRTKALLAHGDDPTLALYAACRKLQEGGADLIAIPCNTAHAFLDRIQPALNIPILNMLSCAADYLRDTFSNLGEVGVLATSGTLASRVFEKELGARGFAQIAPAPAAQARLMNAVYGPRGAKAGYTTGGCLDDLAAAVDDLVGQGAQVIVLGCTELPLLLRGATLARPGGLVVRLVDPTEGLARRCVAYALGHGDAPDALRELERAQESALASAHAAARPPGAASVYG
jgi:aspartate racemase